MSIVDNRRKENIATRMLEFYTSDKYTTLEDLFTKAFDAGVAAQSDYQESQRQEAMEKARELYNAQRDTEPVAFMSIMPGAMITIITGDDHSK